MCSLTPSSRGGVERQVVAPVAAAEGDLPVAGHGVVGRRRVAEGDALLLAAPPRAAARGDLAREQLRRRAARERRVLGAERGLVPGLVVRPRR